MVKDVTLGWGKSYSVWVGGSEVNAFYLSKGEAERLAEEWTSKGYDEVSIDNYLQDKGE